MNVRVQEAGEQEFLRVLSVRGEALQRDPVKASSSSSAKAEA